MEKVATDISTHTVKQLKIHLRGLNLPVSGNKAVLIKRIRDYEISKSKYPYIKNEVGTTDPSPKLFNSSFPKDLQKEILLNLTDVDLINTCRTSSEAATVCEDDDFWRLRIEKIYHSDLSKYKEKHKTYREVYIELRQPKGNGNLLLMAAQLGYLPIVKYLVEELNTSVHSSDGIYTVLYYASASGHLSIVKYLVEHGADVNYFAGIPIQGASHNGHLSIVQYLMEHGANMYLNHALKIAASTGRLDIVKYFVEQGVDLLMYDNVALRSAAKSGYLDVVKYLIDHGADIHSGGVSPGESLRLAMQNKHYSVVKYLIEHGADIRIPWIPISDIKDLLRAWKLKVSGTKEALFTRIIEYVQG